MGKKGRASLSPEEILARQFRAKCRFKATIRYVIANLYWLSDVEDEELGDNIQRNVMLITRKKETKGLLSLQDKAILNKPAEDRTEVEKIHLNRVIGGLKCFRRYPSHVKRQLAAVTYYVYYGPGRVMIKQDGFATAIYFLISGDVAISREAFDPVVNEMVKIPLGEMGPGSLFGEVSLLHDIPRTATVTTLNDCEMLSLRRDDFNIVLKATVQEQWNEILASMAMFAYFDGWDEISKREACILGKIIYFEPEQTILGDGCGMPEYVYFILQGQCRLIEHLYVITEIYKGFKYYRIHTPLEESTTNMSKTSTTQELNRPKPRKSTLSPKGDELKPIKVDSKTAMINKSLIVLKEESKSGLRDRSKSMMVGEGDEVSETQKRVSTVSIKAELKEALEEKSKRDSKASIKRKSRVSIRLSRHEEQKGENEGNDQSLVKSAEIMETRSSFRLSLPESKRSHPRLRSAPELYFMQVCFFNPTAAFGIGENMKNRRIVAIKKTKCLLIPRYWLMTKNKGNIWSRIQQFLNNHVPSTKQIFKEFNLNKKWLSNRKKLLEDILAKSHSVNDNNYSNVPYTIRINEDLVFP